MDGEGKTGNSLGFCKWGVLTPVTGTSAEPQSISSESRHFLCGYHRNNYTTGSRVSEAG